MSHNGIGVSFRASGDPDYGCTVPKTGAALGEVLNCVIANNRVHGILVAASAGYRTHGKSAPRILNCLVAENGFHGVHIQGDDRVEPEIVNCTIVGNVQAGVRCVNSSTFSTVELRNSIIAACGVGLNSTGSSSKLQVTFSNIWGNIEYDYVGIENPTGTEGNISDDPHFFDGYHLGGLSPCIDSGDGAEYAGQMDLYGGPRVANGRVDIGADEFPEERVFPAALINRP